MYNYDKSFVLFSLIHELVHINLFDFFERYKISLLDLESIVSCLTAKVGSLIFSERMLKKLCKLSEFDGSYFKVWERAKELEKIWDKEKSLKKLIKSRRFQLWKERKQSF